MFSSVRVSTGLESAAYEATYEKADPPNNIVHGGWRFGLMVCAAGIFPDSRFLCEHVLGDRRFRGYASHILILVRRVDSESWRYEAH